VNNIALTILLTTSLFTAFPAQAGDIFEAICNDNFDEVNRLVQANPRVVNSKNNYGSTPLHTAAYYENQEMAIFLLNSGANPNVRQNNTLMTPLHTASMRDKTGNIVRKLIEFDAHLNGKDDVDYEIPLHTAVRFGNISAVKKLVQSGSYLNHRNRSNEKPLDSIYESTSCSKEDIKFINDLNTLNTQFNSTKNKQLFFQKVRYEKIIPTEIIDLFACNLCINNLVKINTAYPKLSLKNLNLFDGGRAPVSQLKILLAHLNPTTHQLSFL
jgi:ankyrin repeat protein